MDRTNFRGIAAVILAVGALVTAVATAVKKPEEAGARAAYLELTKTGSGEARAR